VKELAQLLNEMQRAGVIRNYALFGAVAQMRYTEAATQFVPAFSPLTQEAMEQAETADFEGVPFRVIRADHLAVIALSVGRAKNLTRDD